MMLSTVSFFIRKYLRTILVLLVIGNLVIIGLLGTDLLKKPETSSPLQKSVMPSEIKGIIAAKNVTLQSQLYRKLIERVGPVQAQEDLLHSGLPFDGETHLINHTVGDWLYTKYGEKGIIYCKDYFLSSCYHGFLIRVIAEKGFTDLKQVMDECNKVGITTAVQCSHAIGHGLLAWEDYPNLPKALADCDIVATLSPKFTAYNCYDGVFMENNWAVHDDGKPSEYRWVKAEEPTYPCYDNRIAEKYRRACWSNQPQVMYKLFKGDIDKIAKECENIQAVAYQDTCFDAIARQINPLTRGNAQLVFSLCNKMPVGWKNACVNSNVSAYFSVGDHKLPFTICAMIPDTGEAKCYETLQQRIASYVPTLNERAVLCAQVPKDFVKAQFCPLSTP